MEVSPPKKLIVIIVILGSSSVQTILLSVLLLDFKLMNCFRTVAFIILSEISLTWKVFFGRYVTGLEKLKEAKYLITELQEELKLLQPRLVETSANTEALMIKIEQDTIQVERKKEVWCNLH